MTRAVLVAVVLLAGCAERVANRCPDMPEPRCVTGTICAMDEKRGCQVCRCDTPYLVPPSQPPQGMPQPVR